MQELLQAASKNSFLMIWPRDFGIIKVLESIVGANDPVKPQKGRF
ncbi:MAG: hypothetical protein UEP57_06360 [Oscillospiraceae bacterium]|nr:hypothetical protein [Oscillospiraceae bacterium]